MISNIICKQFITKFLCLLSIVCLSLAVRSEVLELQAANVSSKSISLAWLSDASLSDASVMVFADPSGVFDISSTVTIEIQTASSLSSHSNGMVLAKITGLDANTQYFFRTISQTAMGTVTYPVMPSLFEVTTAQRFALEDPLVSQRTLANGLFRTSVIDPSTSASLDGALVFAHVNGIDSYPVVSINRSSTLLDSPPEALLDLNNIFEVAGSNLGVGDDTAVLLTEWRGLACANTDEQERIYFARTPPANPTAAVRRVSTPVSCYPSDAVCDEQLNVLDFQFILNSLNAAINDCKYSRQLDVVLDGLIDSDDYGEIVLRLDDVAPF